LGKSGSRVNTPEDGDSRLTIPGILSPIVEIPFPFGTFFSVFQAAVVANKSFIIDIAVTFQAGANTTIISVGPGLWEFTLKQWLEEAGAVSDATSNCSVQYFPNSGVGATVTLTRVTNKQGIEQNHLLNWKQLITAEDVSYSFLQGRVNGLGTGLNVSRTVLVANRLF
jgi:hypothetical protein